MKIASARAPRSYCDCSLAASPGRTASSVPTRDSRSRSSPAARSPRCASRTRRRHRARPRAPRLPGAARPRGRVRALALPARRRGRRPGTARAAAQHRTDRAARLSARRSGRRGTPRLAGAAWIEAAAPAVPELDHRADPGMGASSRRAARRAAHPRGPRRARSVGHVARAVMARVASRHAWRCRGPRRSARTRRPGQAT